VLAIPLRLEARARCTLKLRRARPNFRREMRVCKHLEASEGSDERPCQAKSTTWPLRDDLPKSMLLTAHSTANGSKERGRCDKFVPVSQHPLGRPRSTLSSRNIGCNGSPVFRLPTLAIAREDSLTIGSIEVRAHSARSAPLRRYVRFARP
jgi:hypothetical protein